MALLSVGVALGFQKLLWPFMSSSPFLFFFGAVMMSGWWGGWRPACVATLVSLALTDYFFLLPFHTLKLGAGNSMTLGLYGLLSAFITWLNERLRRINAERADLLEREREARDLAERERTRYHALLMQAPAHIALFRGPEHVYELSNPLNNDLLGHRNLLGRPVREASPTDQSAAIARLLDNVYATGESYTAREMPIRVSGQDGTEREIVFNLVYQPTFDVRGQVDGIAGFGFDVTDQAHARKRAESLAVENARLYREAQEAIRLRDEFLSIASHELKTPLTPLSLKLQALARELARTDGPLPRAVVQSYVEVGTRQVKKLSELMNDLLDVSRIAAGRLTLDVAEVDLAALVREVVGRHEAQAARVGSPVHLEGADAPVIGWWDGLRLEQVVMNLVDNAIKYGGGRPLHVRLHAGPERATLMVRDEGIGIASEHLPRIFGRFERAVSDRHYGGLGLGLYITRTLVDALGGTVSVESELGQGSTFTVELPRGAAPREP
jgi:signal transduction histidine kinase